MCGFFIVFVCLFYTYTIHWMVKIVFNVTIEIYFKNILAYICILIGCVTQIIVCYYFQPIFKLLVKLLNLLSADNDIYIYQQLLQYFIVFTLLIKNNESSNWNGGFKVFHRSRKNCLLQCFTKSFKKRNYFINSENSKLNTSFSSFNVKNNNKTVLELCFFVWVLIGNGQLLLNFFCVSDFLCMGLVSRSDDSSCCES